MKRRTIILFILSLTYVIYSQTLSLDECVQSALENNPDLQKSEFSLQQSQISTKQAWSALYPTASANASTSRSGALVSDTQDNADWNWSLGGSVNQQFYRPGMYSGIGLARVRQESSEYSVAALQSQIRATVEKLYFQILASDTLVGVYEANIRLSDEQIVKMERMVDVGFKRQSDLLKSRVQRGTFETQLIREIETAASTRRTLNILMGRQPNATFDVIPLAVDRISIPEYRTAFTMMLEDNPDIKRLKSQVDVQKLSLGIAREAYLPSMSGSYSYSQRQNTFGGPAIESDQVSIHLSIDLFDGFSKSQNVQKSSLNLDEARLDYEAALRDLDEALSNQYMALDTQNKLIAIHETNLISARKDLEVVSEQYATGFSTILDLTDAQVSVLESETNLLRDLYTRKQIEAEIRRLIGN